MIDYSESVMRIGYRLFHIRWNVLNLATLTFEEADPSPPAVRVAAGK
jgi:hypothetical protein